MVVRVSLPFPSFHQAVCVAGQQWLVWIPVEKHCLQVRPVTLCRRTTVQECSAGFSAAAAVMSAVGDPSAALLMAWNLSAWWSVC